MGDEVGTRHSASRCVPRTLFRVGIRQARLRHQCSTSSAVPRSTVFVHFIFSSGCGASCACVRCVLPQVQIRGDDERGRMGTASGRPSVGREDAKTGVGGWLPAARVIATLEALAMLLALRAFFPLVQNKVRTPVSVVPSNTDNRRSGALQNELMTSKFLRDQRSFVGRTLSAAKFRRSRLPVAAPVLDFPILSRQYSASHLSASHSVRLTSRFRTSWTRIARLSKVFTEMAVPSWTSAV